MSSLTDKIEARRLRSEEGLSLVKIAQRVGRAKSTVSLWVRDIEVSEEVRGRLNSRAGIRRPDMKPLPGHGFVSRTETMGHSYNPKGVGEASEGQIIAALLKSGKVILTPFGDNQRYDLVVDEDGDFVRVQCKTARLTRIGFVFATSSNNWNTKTYRGYVGEADVFAVYLRENDLVYFFSVKNCPKKECSVRLGDDASMRGRLASNHLFVPGKSLRSYL